MKISTYNVNGITARLPVLLRWLEETKPDVACLQELKTPQEISGASHKRCGLPRHLARTKKLEWCGHIFKK